MGATEQLHNSNSYKTLSLVIDGHYCGIITDINSFQFSSTYGSGVWGNMFVHLAGDGKGKNGIIGGVSDMLCKGAGDAVSKVNAGLQVSIGNMARLNGITLPGSAGEGYGFWGRKYYNSSSEPDITVIATRLTHAESVNFTKNILCGGYMIPKNMGGSSNENLWKAIGSLYNPLGYIWPDTKADGSVTMPRNWNTLSTMFKATMESIYSGPNDQNNHNRFLKEFKDYKAPLVSLNDRVAVDLWWLIAPKVTQDAVRQNTSKDRGSLEFKEIMGNNDVEFDDVKFSEVLKGEGLSKSLETVKNTTLNGLASTAGTLGYTVTTLMGLQGDLYSALLKNVMPLISVQAPKLIQTNQIQIYFNGATSTKLTRSWLKLSQPWDGDGLVINKMHGQAYAIKSIQMTPSNDLDRSGVPLWFDVNIGIAPIMKSTANAFRDGVDERGYNNGHGIDDVIKNFMKSVNEAQQKIDRYDRVSFGNDNVQVDPRGIQEAAANAGDMTEQKKRDTMRELEYNPKPKLSTSTSSGAPGLTTPMTTENTGNTYSTFQPLQPPQQPTFNMLTGR